MVRALKGRKQSQLMLIRMQPLSYCECECPDAKKCLNCYYFHIYVQLKQVPTEEGRNAELALYRRRPDEAEAILIQVCGCAGLLGAVCL